MTPASAVAAVRAALSDDLRRPPYRGDPNPMVGHCYVAAEALWHLLKDPAWVPQHLNHGGPHWYLKHSTTGEILDPTHDQFESCPIPYHRGRGKGFLTLKPSRRAAVVLSRIPEE